MTPAHADLAPTLRRLLHTITAHLHPRRTAAAIREITAVLPAEAAAVVHDVVRRTRLGRREKVGVAQELTGHFQGGLDAGSTVDQLVRDFGNVKLAARLIRRAKLRCRPLTWQVAGWAGRSLIAGLIFYAAAGLYLITRQPAVTVNDAAKIIGVFPPVPMDQRAWPLYKQTLEQLQNAPGIDDRHAPVRPGDPDWAAAERWLIENPSVLQRIRTAARKPALGCVPTPGASASLSDGITDKTPVVWSLTYPYLAGCRKISRLLLLDARRAVRTGDGATTAADLEAAIGLVRQLGLPRPSTWIEQLVAMRSADEITNQIDEILVASPLVLSDPQWAALAHDLAALDPLFQPDVSDERYFFDDLVQRLYAAGDDGRVTWRGLQQLHDIRSGDLEIGLGFDPAHRPWASVLTYPALAYSIAPRREIVQEFDRLMDLTEARLHRRMWEWGPDPVARSLRGLSNTQRLRWAPVCLFMPSLAEAGEVAERARMRRDAAVVAIAIERYRRREGVYPPTLEAMGLGLLARVPRDVFTGEALRYRIVDAKPVVYSVGTNRKDDDGRPTASPAAAQRWLSREQLDAISPAERRRIDGDWVLFDARTL